MRAKRVRKEGYSLYLLFLLYAFNLIVVRVTHASDYDVQNPDFSHNTIYQIVTDRFNDGNKLNNPVGNLFDKNDNRKYHGGDWEGIIKKIEDGYLTELGISAIWISSPVENITTIDPSNNSASYHGYWGRDFFAPNKAFGDINDFKRLIDTAHNNGIKVIIDFAPNHTSTAEFKDMKFYEDGVLLKHGEFLGSYNNDPLKLFNREGWTDFSSYENGIYHSLFGLADLDHSNNIVDEYMKEAIKYWLDLGIDGIRVDAVKHMSFGWQKNWLSSIYEKRNVFIFGEWFTNSDNNDYLMTEFTNKNGMSLLDFRFANSVRELLTNKNYTMYKFYNMILQTQREFSEVNDQVTFVDNHDMSRIYSLTKDNKLVNIAHAILLTSRGVPTIYYGSENYLPGASDPDNRASIETFSKTSNSYKIISKLAMLRKESSAVAHGNTVERWINDNIIIYERQFGDDVVLVAINRSGDTYSVKNAKTNLPDRKYNDYLGDLQNGSNIMVKDGVIENIDIKPYSVSVWYAKSKKKEAELGDIDPSIAIQGNRISISGMNLKNHIREINIEGKKARIVKKTDSYIEFIVPKISAGNRKINFITIDGKIKTKEIEILSKSQVAHRFILENGYTRFGESIYVIGNIHELGSWNTGEAIGPFFNDTKSVAKYPNWFFDVNLPENTEIEYKFIKKDQNGNIVWESGLNRYLRTTDKSGRTTDRWR